MCCRCCTTLKVAAKWGASIQTGVGVLMLVLFFVIDENLGDFYIPYLVYIGLMIPLGLIILLSVHKEVDRLIRWSTWLFLLNQLFGFVVRLLVPAQNTSWTVLTRIAVLFCCIIATIIYSMIVLWYARKLRKAKKAARKKAEEEAAAAAELEEEAAGLETGTGPRSSIEDPTPPRVIRSDA